MTSVPDPPVTLSEDAQTRWQIVAPALARRGAIDVESLATYCQLWVRWRKAEADIAKTGQLVKKPRGGVTASPLIAVSNQAANQVRALERRLGIGAAEPEPHETETTVSTASPLLTRRELATVLSVHMQTVTKWEQEGMPIAKRGRKGKASHYREVEVRAWLRQREDAANQGTAMDLAQERAQKERWQGLLAEQTYLLRQRKLLPAEEVEKLWSAEVAAVRTVILATYTTHADRIFRAATLEGLAGVDRELKALAYEVLRELSAPSKKDSAA